VNGISAKMKIGAGHTLLVHAKGSEASSNLLAVNLPLIKPTVKKPSSRKGKKVASRSAGKHAAKKSGRHTPASKNAAAKRPRQRS
jgi:hypothetical protein